MPQYFATIKVTLGGKTRKIRRLVQASTVAYAYRVARWAIYQELKEEDRKLVTFDNAGHTRLRSKETILSSNQRHRQRRADRLANIGGPIAGPQSLQANN